jgi:hypothetical protein
MQKKSSLFFGIFLTLLGGLSLVGNFLLKQGQSRLSGFALWPLFVVATGLLFCMPPFFFHRTRGLAGLLIPGLPVLTTGIILYICAVTGDWGLWTSLWPLELVSVGLAFLIMSVWMRLIWLGIPASIIGLNGLVLLFCVTTGLWSSWLVLWTVEPFFVGLPLLVIGLKYRYRSLTLAGASLSAFSAVALAATSLITISSWWLIVSIFSIGLGLILFGLGYIKPKKWFPRSRE